MDEAKVSKPPLWKISQRVKEQRPEIMKIMPVVDGRRGWIAVGMVWTKRQKNWV